MFGRLFKTSEPTPGSLLVTTWHEGLAEIAGIYIGSHKVVTILESGGLQEIPLNQFTEIHTAKIRSELYICSESSTRRAVSFPQAITRAQSLLEGRFGYRIVLMNSHQLCSGCITGNFDNEDHTLQLLTAQVEETIGKKVEWRKKDL
ncbi:hypothetical protein DCC85_04690 [Paenibacillus sp. CAA11]|uniref:hypothetical protein n=1 Tax=Paenibacillus sp. CAA11 TaxID=1532905 RepID=UPI000D3DC115|nr:hypothetical protein [Paenibacillus sp. CAA11]AWB43590.1 hypothetical protein DCC85_04690 [Paenibacillus sp. CAA11]